MQKDKVREHSNLKRLSIIIPKDKWIVLRHLVEEERVKSIQEAVIKGIDLLITREEAFSKI